MLRLLSVLIGALLLSACKITPYGASAPYADLRGDHPKVVMPPGAPSITGQVHLAPDLSDPERRRNEHQGIDIFEQVGTPVLAFTDAVVLRAHYEPMFGHQVVLDHGAAGDGARMISKYRHLDARQVVAGDRVRRGAQIGTLGTTGLMSQGYPHLHVELWRQTAGGRLVPVDPQLYWADGPGRVSCFTPRRRFTAAPDRLTYPVPCRPH
ncbi:M23 family metallopeptidase [Shimia sp.]|uniref:M23 family metallopeptidase n=1 Tax=Shimia sp. TaxID=1954381 RepID=UPI00356AE769